MEGHECFVRQIEGRTGEGVRARGRVLPRRNCQVFSLTPSRSYGSRNADRCTAGWCLVEWLN